jgi:branched-chain amino acid transport system permease protein
MVALSFVLIYLPARFFHFAHGAVFAWAAYFAYLCHTWLGQPLWLAVPLGVLACGGLGAGLERAVYFPLRRRGAGNVELLVASLGLYALLQNTISMVFGDETKRLGGTSVMEGVNVFGGRVTPTQLCIVFTCIASFLVVWAVLRFTRLGRALRAVASDPELAMAQGVRPNRVILVAFASGSVLAGLASVLVALDVGMNPTMGLNALMMGVVAAVVGGIGSVPGVFLGGLFLGLSQHLGVWRIGTEWQDSIVFLILILFLVFRPQGFFGEKLRKAGV